MTDRQTTDRQQTDDRQTTAYPSLRNCGRNKKEAVKNFKSIYAKLKKIDLRMRSCSKP